MKVPKEKLDDIEMHITGLFNHLTISNVQDRAPYVGYLDDKHLFSLDEDGYYLHYQSLKKSILSLENYGQKWSDNAISEKIHTLLLELAQIKNKNMTPLQKPLTQSRHDTKAQRKPVFVSKNVLFCL